MQVTLVESIINYQRSSFVPLSITVGYTNITGNKIILIYFLPIQGHLL